MTDEREVGSEFSPAVSVAGAPTNGTGEHADAPPDAPAAPEEGSAIVAEATAPEPDTQETDGPVADVDSAEAAAEPDFMTQLTRAMQATAGAERSRVTDDIDRRRSAHIATIHGRRDAEVARMRELADDDRKAIDSWAATEHRRIQVERDRRTTELQVDLTRSLEEHSRQVDEKVQTIEFAVTAHRAEVDAFFDALEAETDPVRIAQQAGLRPVFPDLEAVVATTLPSPAEPEPSVVGVMDPIARLGLLTTTEHVSPAQAMLAATPPTADSGAGPSVMTLVSSRTSGRPEEAPQPAAASAPASSSSSSTSSGLNPMGWLRRGNDQGDRS